MTGMATMVYSKRLGLFNPTEATEQKSETAELNNGNALLQHVRQYVHAYMHTHLYTHAHLHFYVGW